MQRRPGWADMLHKNKFYTGCGWGLLLNSASEGAIVPATQVRSRTCVRTYALVIVFVARRRVTRALPRVVFIYVLPRKTAGSGGGGGSTWSVSGVEN